MALPTARVAIRQALADYLRTNLVSAWPNLVVAQDWPIPDVRMPKQALTVLVPQNGATVEYHQPVVWGTTVTTTTGAATITYSYGRAEFPIQIDAWAQFPAVRDALAAAVLPLLNRNVEETLGVATLSNIHTAPGLVIPLPTYANVTAEYRFDPEPMLTETTSYAEVSDFRATWSGTVTVYLMQQETQPLMTDVTVKMGMNGDAPTDIYPYSYPGYVLADSPILYWRMDEVGNPNTTTDHSGHNNIGSVDQPGQVTFGSPGLLTNDITTAASASTAQSRVHCVTNLGSMTAFSVEWWIKPSAVTAGGNDIGQAFGVFYCRPNADGSLSLGTTNSITTAAGTYAVNKKVYCVFTYDGTNGCFYVNGLLANGPTAMAAPSGPFNAFAFSNTGPWQATIQEIAFYNKALSATRVLSHYLIGSNGP